MTIATQPTFVGGRLVKPGRPIPAPVEPDEKPESEADKPRSRRAPRKTEDDEKPDGGE